MKAVLIIYEPNDLELIPSKGGRATPIDVSDLIDKTSYIAFTQVLGGKMKKQKITLNKAMKQAVKLFREADAERKKNKRKKYVGN